MKNKKGVYLGAYIAEHHNYDIVYQDINGKRDIGGDMMDVDLSDYDYIIATPPCNYYSRANWRREVSEYSQKTKHLLPKILNKLRHQSKPYIVENVRNKKLMQEFYYWPNEYVYVIGRHTYWTNFALDVSKIKQIDEPKIQYIASNNRQGGANVALVIDAFLKEVNK